GREVDPRVPHVVAVDAHQPGPLGRRAHHPGVRLAVLAVAEEALAPRLAGMRLLAALEAQVRVVAGAGRGRGGGADGCPGAFRRRPADSKCARAASISPRMGARSRTDGIAMPSCMVD